ncbi:MAG: hypothetical protein K6E52_08230 [Bacteroidaceae bacterium]|nr:hypothetical protein [Bacteroidaceae bacterium]
MNPNRKIRFVAIDCETANRHDIICQIGIAVVYEGSDDIEVIERLVNPPLDEDFEPQNVSIHHITREQTQNEPFFDSVWADLLPYLEGQEIWAHNAKGAEIRYLRKNFARYKDATAGINIENIKCTCALYGGRSVPALCIAFGMGYDSATHHSAGYDAKCCAMFLLNYLNGKQPNYNLAESFHSSKRQHPWAEKEIPKELCRRDWSKANINSPFFNREVVITGQLSEPRANIARKIQIEGGINNKDIIQQRTDFLIVGANGGTKKLEDAERVNNSESRKNNPIKFLYQEDLNRIFSGYGDEYKAVKAGLEDKDPTHPLYERIVYIFGKWKYTSQLKKELKNVGAEVASSLTKYVTYILLGEDPSTDELEEIQKLRFNGFNACILRSYDVQALLHQSDFFNREEKMDWQRYIMPIILTKKLDFSFEHYMHFHVSFKGLENIIAQKELFFGKGFKSNPEHFYQITGNLGAFGNWVLSKEVDICVLSNSTLEKLKEGVKDETIKYIEKTYNEGDSDQFLYTFMSEQDVLDYCKFRCETYGDEVTMRLYKKYLNIN